MSTVQNKEVSTLERATSSKKCLGGPEGVHNRWVSTIERCPHREVLLYLFDHNVVQVAELLLLLVLDFYFVRFRLKQAKIA